jgi:peptidoglycan hydrolase-like protein with peptidoglycan-binding domain
MEHSGIRSDFVRAFSRLLVLLSVALVATGAAASAVGAAETDLVFEGWSDSSPWTEVVSVSDLVSEVPAVGAVGALVSVSAGSCTESGFMSELVFTGDAGDVNVAAAVLETALGWPSADVLSAGAGVATYPGCWSGGDFIEETRRLRIAEVSIGDGSGGDGDGIAECSESVVVGLTLASVTETISNAQVVVGVLGSEASLVGPATSLLPDMTPGQTLVVPLDFDVVIADVVSGYDWVTLVVTVGSADAVYEMHRHIPIGCGLTGSAEVSPRLTFPVAGTNYYEREWLTTHNPGIHEGVDIFASRMVPILAVADGVVADVNWEHDPHRSDPTSCCSIALIHDSGWESWSLHLNNDTPGTDDGAGWGLMPGIKRGTRVSAGQVIGFIGDSSNAEGTAPHIHIELHDPAGNPVDPYDYLKAASVSDPICPDGFAAECSPFVIMSWNSRDPQVWVLQTLLGQAGFSPGTIDGSFGSLTDASVREFQAAAGLGVDGLVDRETWDELNRVVDEGIDLQPDVIARLGDRGPIVIEVQGLLTQNGFSPGPVDGIFGTRTETAVRSFQSEAGLPVDGLVDAPTLDALEDQPASSVVVRLGDRGIVVREVQHLLADAGFPPGPVDGIFGYFTEHAVRSFQSSRGLAVDGAVGDATFAALNGDATRVIIASFGDQGLVVIEVQRLLSDSGHSPGAIDGIFGSMTQAAVRSFQTASGLPSDGVIDQATINALS